jgi:D-alanyl-lipoteichoic acid acyltransferase DltB (MBOAT superfamily)
MVVNSVRFLFFFIVVFTIYYLPFTKKIPRRQNIWLLLASYFFYGIVDWKMVVILLVATAVFYALGLWLRAVMLKGRTKQASHLTTLGVILGICLLL